MPAQKKQKLTSELVALIISHSGPLFNADPDEILGRRREEKISNARFAAVWVASKVAYAEFSDLAVSFNRNKPMIIYILQQVLDRRSLNDDFKAKSDALLDVVNMEILAKNSALKP